MPAFLTRRLSRLVIIIAGVAAAVAVAVPRADAATFEVTNMNSSGPGSLSQAVADANLAPGADTISFAVTGTIRPAATLVVNGGPLSIDGPGPALLTVSGNGTKRILTQSTSTNLAVSGLTLADGAAPGFGGGAILNNGGTIAVSDTVFLRNSAFAGGAIENVNGGILAITNSTFSGNSALPGGAISNYRSTLTIANSTFVGNSGAVGGAIYNLSFATIRVTNSTFSGNTASFDGPALRNDGLTVSVENTIFADNGCAPYITDAGGNLDWPDSACPGVNGDPRLGELADNGGPTPTMALGLGSAAIDAALSASCPATDQRGVARPFGAGCDIGAYESNVLDMVPPVIAIPTGIVADATGPNGAAVSYSASAVDDVDGSVAVVCVPPSGATFPIGTTRVTCEASDTAGNTASAAFDVRVKGAREQLDDLIGAVAGIGPGSSIADKLLAARAALDERQLDDACQILAASVHESNAQSGKKLTPEQAAVLITSATRIRAVLSC